jgi:hypothetical protein
MWMSEFCAASSRKPRPGSLVQEARGGLVYLYALLAKLQRALHPLDEGDGDDRADEQQRYRWAVWPVRNVRQSRVREDERDEAEYEGCHPTAHALGGYRRADGSRGHHREDTPVA